MRLAYASVSRSYNEVEARGTRPLPELYTIPSGKALLVISHDENHFDIADRVIRLQDGRVLEDAPLAIGCAWS